MRAVFIVIIARCAFALFGCKAKHEKEKKIKCTWKERLQMQNMWNETHRVGNKWNYAVCVTFIRKNIISFSRSLWWWDKNDMGLWIRVNEIMNARKGDSGTRSNLARMLTNRIRDKLDKRHSAWFEASNWRNETHFTIHRSACHVQDLENGKLREVVLRSMCLDRGRWIHIWSVNRLPRKELLCN